MAAAAESLSASIPAKLIRVEPEGFLKVALIVDAMLPRWVIAPSELRGLEPRVVLKLNEVNPPLAALSVEVV
jgi:hypothetical protein